MNSQGQVSLPNLLNAFNAAGIPVNSYQLANNLGGNYSMNNVNAAVSKLGLTQDQLNAVRQSLGTGPTAPVSSSQWWNTASNNNMQGWSNGMNSQLNSGSLNANNGQTLNSGCLMANNAQPSGSDWVIVMNSDTFLQLAKSGAMQL